MTLWPGTRSAGGGLPVVRYAAAEARPAAARALAPSAHKAWGARGAAGHGARAHARPRGMRMHRSRRRCHQEQAEPRTVADREEPQGPVAQGTLGPWRARSRRICLGVPEPGGVRYARDSERSGDKSGLFVPFVTQALC